MKAKITTKIGDKGMTRLVDGSCVEKFNPRVEAYGTLDELNSSLGLVRAALIQSNLIGTEEKFRNFDASLFRIQNHLFVLGSLLATVSDESFQKLTQIENFHIVFLENEIDSLDEELQPLKNFIIPAGHQVTAFLHMSRTLCRRGERRCAEISIQDQRYSLALIYLNRLSDYLFTAARWMQHQAGLPDIIWDPKA
ncbi:MAG: cob(I)yrinic acid a,c-diamide adenosyltransferase [Bdellovibrionaceae bacterium]|nr:cob(I)yrinic acid a,c-diamide adenosyltransferase [Pseudobdellovibrionaceae bacterium]